MTDHRPRPRLLEPSRVQPVLVDLRRVFWAGTAIWFVALVVAALGWRGEEVEARTVATCAAGVLLGFAALLWEHRRRRRARREADAVTAEVRDAVARNAGATGVTDA